MSFIKNATKKLNQVDKKNEYYKVLEFLLNRYEEAVNDLHELQAYSKVTQIVGDTTSQYFSNSSINNKALGNSINSITRNRIHKQFCILDSVMEGIRNVFWKKYEEYLSLKQKEERDSNIYQVKDFLNAFDDLFDFDSCEEDKQEESLVPKSLINRLEQAFEYLKDRNNQDVFVIVMRNNQGEK